MRHAKYLPLLSVMVILLLLVPGMIAQVKKDKTTGEDRVEGTILSVNKDTSTISLQQSGKSVRWQIVFNKDTQFTFQNKPSTVAEVKEGRRIICLGKYEADKLVASRIEVRTEK